MFWVKVAKFVQKMAQSCKICQCVLPLYQLHWVVWRVRESVCPSGRVLLTLRSENGFLKLLRTFSKISSDKSELSISYHRLTDFKSINVLVLASKYGLQIWPRPMRDEVLDPSTLLDIQNNGRVSCIVFGKKFNIPGLLFLISNRYELAYLVDSVFFSKCVQNKSLTKFEFSEIEKANENREKGRLSIKFTTKMYQRVVLHTVRALFLLSNFISTSKALTRYSGHYYVNPAVTNCLDLKLSALFAPPASRKRIPYGSFKLNISHKISVDTVTLENPSKRNRTTRPMTSKRTEGRATSLLLLRRPEESESPHVVITRPETQFERRMDVRKRSAKFVKWRNTSKLLITLIINLLNLLLPHTNTVHPLLLPPRTYTTKTRPTRQTRILTNHSFESFALHCPKKHTCKGGESPSGSEKDWHSVQVTRIRLLFELVHPKLTLPTLFVHFPLRCLDSPIESPKNHRKQTKIHPVLFSVCIFISQATTKEADAIASLISIMLSGDVEKNPGPKHPEDPFKITILSQNCRGLNDTTKRNLLLAQCNKLKSINPFFVIGLQETHLTQVGTDVTDWPGKIIVSNATTSRGGGCITFLGEGINILKEIHMDERGHLLLVAGLLNSTTIIANVYAPVRDATNQQEIFYNTFIQNFNDLIADNEPNTPLILLGDLNISLTDLGRGRSKYSKRNIEIVNRLSRLLEVHKLTSFWNHSDDFYSFKNTGQHTYSQLDIIAVNMPNYRIAEAVTDWTFVKSDHALLKLTMKANSVKNNPKSTITPRLSPGWLENDELVNKVLLELGEVLETTTPNYWKSDMVLDFAKVWLRGKMYDEIKLIKNKFNQDLLRIKTTLQRLINVDRNRLTLLRANEVDLEIERLSAERDAILERKGKCLSNLMKKQWYDEGEKGTTFFLKSLQTMTTKTDITCLNINGNLTENEEEIENEVVNFYTELYNQNATLNQDIDLFREIEPSNKEDAELLAANLTQEELKLVLDTCKNSAPGPDGICYEYYKAFWPVFGPILVNVFNDSIRRGQFPESQRHSYLRLIPKEGKDLTLLKNWRPITLSNCDYKLYTKALSFRLTKLISNKLHPSQTAYLPGRQIHDNIRLVQIAQRHSEGLLTMLDAQKAFDSISHTYIRNMLNAHGLPSFTKIFNALYEDQRVDILMGKKPVKGYIIRNGVKQGDSLSCILFIMAMDPLLRKIEINQAIVGIEINNQQLPKCLAYADDVMCITENKESLGAIFKLYERFTKASGLKLNADKTELFSFAGNEIKENIEYLGNRFNLESKSQVKVNGIWLSNEQGRAQSLNYKEIKQRIINQLTNWNRRGLTLLGRILVYKTFGLSQVIYRASIAILSPEQINALETIFMNFVWKKPLLGPKAKGRIKHKQLNSDIVDGGFGMVSLSTIMNGIYCKQLLRMTNPEYSHPLSLVTVENASNTNIITTSLKPTADEISITGQTLLLTKLLQQYKTIDFTEIQHNQKHLDIISMIRLENVRKTRYNESAYSALIHTYGVTDMQGAWNNANRLQSTLKKVIQAPWFKLIKRIATEINFHSLHEPTPNMLIIKSKPIPTHKLTSKSLRCYLQNKPLKPVCCKYIETDEQAARLHLERVKKLPSTRHKNIALRLWNGDILSNNRLKKMCVIENENCDYCGNLETQMHLLLECPRSKRLWQLVMETSDEVSLEQVIGFGCSLAELELRMECLLKLVKLRTVEPEVIMSYSKRYLNEVKSKDGIGTSSFQIDVLL